MSILLKIVEHYGLRSVGDIEPFAVVCGDHAGFGSYPEHVVVGIVLTPVSYGNAAAFDTPVVRLVGSGTLG